MTGISTTNVFESKMNVVLRQLAVIILLIFLPAIISAAYEIGPKIVSNEVLSQTVFEDSLRLSNAQILRHDAEFHNDPVYNSQKVSATERVNFRSDYDRAAVELNEGRQRKVGLGEFDPDAKGQTENLFAVSRSTIGHVITSTDPRKTCFHAMDLIYIKVKPSSKNIIQVGDRYMLVSPNKLSDFRHDFDSACSLDPTIAGEVEIICVGENTALGIILYARSSIFQGESVCRIDKKSFSSIRF